MTREERVPPETVFGPESPTGSRTLDGDDGEDDSVTLATVMRRSVLTSTAPALTGVETHTEGDSGYYQMEAEYERAHTPHAETAALIFYPCDDPARGYDRESLPLSLVTRWVRFPGLLVRCRNQPAQGVPQGQRLHPSEFLLLHQVFPAISNTPFHQLSQW